MNRRGRSQRGAPPSFEATLSRGRTGGTAPGCCGQGGEPQSDATRSRSPGAPVKSAPANGRAQTVRVLLRLSVPPEGGVICAFIIPVRARRPEEERNPHERPADRQHRDDDPVDDDHVPVVPRNMPKPATLTPRSSGYGLRLDDPLMSGLRCQAGVLRSGLQSPSNAASASPIGDPRPVQASHPFAASKAPFVPDVTSRKTFVRGAS